MVCPKDRTLPDHCIALQVDNLADDDLFLAGLRVDANRQNVAKLERRPGFISHAWQQNLQGV